MDERSGPPWQGRRTPSTQVSSSGQASRPRAGLWVKLTDRADLGVVEPLDGAVVSDTCVASRLAGLTGEAVVLRGWTEDPTRRLFQNCDGAAVPERELEGLVARCEREQLVAEADAEDGALPSSDRTTSTCAVSGSGPPGPGFERTTPS